MTPISANALCALLEEYVGGDLQGVGVAFDGDGTLWSGDVGEDVFEYSVSRDLLRDDAQPSLLASAREHHLDVSGTASQMAAQLFAAYRAGRYPERVACEMMTWCYAGMTLTEFDALVSAALDHAGLATRMQTEVLRVVDWAVRNQLTLLVISASPGPIVRRAVQHCGVAPGAVIAAEPLTQQAVISADPGVSVPYAESKARAGRERLGTRRWLASFGDNIFDAEMLKSAEVGVAVRPKPALARHLGNDPRVWLLRPE